MQRKGNQKIGNNGISYYITHENVNKDLIKRMRPRKENARKGEKGEKLAMNKLSN
mgnify:CR=1 FL=1